MLLDANCPIPPHVRVQFCRGAILSLWFASPPESLINPSHTASEYDSQTEGEAKGLVDAVKLSDRGIKKNFVELICQDDEDSVVYLRPKPGFRVKQETPDFDLGHGTRERHRNASLLRWQWQSGMRLADRQVRGRTRDSDETF